MKNATAHLLHGFIGAGKTTYARQLEQSLPALRFTRDEWMHALYGANATAADFDERWQVVSVLIWATALRALALGNDVVLDFGFWTRASRDEARARLVSAGVPWVLHALEADTATLRERVAARNLVLPPDTFFTDTRTFERCYTCFEPLAADEPHHRVCPAGGGI
jgi:predicted kinase